MHTEAAWGLTIGVLLAHYHLSGTQILDPIQPNNEFTMSEHPKLEWVTPKISLLDSEDTEAGKMDSSTEQTPNLPNPQDESFTGPS